MPEPPTSDSTGQQDHISNSAAPCPPCRVGEHRWQRRKVKQTDLAAEFGINRSTVQRILRRHGR